MFYGLDVHKHFVQVHALESTGAKGKRLRIACTREELDRFAGTLGPDDALVLETTFHSWEIAARLRRSGARVVVANSSEVKAIAHARIKTDKIDAATLAHLLRADLIPEVVLPDEVTWQRRKLVTHQRLLVKQRTATKNAIRSQLNQQLLDPEDQRLFTAAGRAALQALPLAALDRFLLDSALDLLDGIDRRVDAVDAQLAAVARDDASVQLLMTLPGVGVTVAVGLAAAIGHIQRFATPGQLTAYFGLVPSTYQSAERCYHGSITKRGSTSARHLAIEAAQVLARSDCPLAATYHRVRRRRPHNVAVTALARKLVVVAWHLLTHQQPYRYAPLATTCRKLRRLHPRRRPPPKTLPALYAEAGLPQLRPAPLAERRVADRARRVLQNQREEVAKSRGLDERS